MRKCAHLADASARRPALPDAVKKQESIIRESEKEKKTAEDEEKKVKATLEKKTAELEAKRAEVKVIDVSALRCVFGGLPFFFIISQPMSVLFSSFSSPLLCFCSALALVAVVDVVDEKRA